MMHTHQLELACGRRTGVFLVGLASRFSGESLIEQMYGKKQSSPRLTNQARSTAMKGTQNGQHAAIRSPDCTFFLEILFKARKYVHSKHMLIPRQTPKRHFFSKINKLVNKVSNISKSIDRSMYTKKSKRIDPIQRRYILL